MGGRRHINETVCGKVAEQQRQDACCEDANQNSPVALRMAGANATLQRFWDAWLGPTPHWVTTQQASIGMATPSHGAASTRCGWGSTANRTAQIQMKQMQHLCRLLWC